MPEMYQVSFQVPYHKEEWITKCYSNLKEARDAIEFYTSFCRFPAKLINA